MTNGSTAKNLENHCMCITQIHTVSRDGIHMVSSSQFFSFGSAKLEGTYSVFGFCQFINLLLP